MDPPFDDDVQAIDRGFLEVNRCEEPYAAYRIEYDLSELKVPWLLQPDRLALGGPRGQAEGPSGGAGRAEELRVLVDRIRPSEPWPPVCKPT